MTKSDRRRANMMARAMVGCACSHRGREGLVVVADLTSYAEPMVVVRFGEGHFATLRPSEVGSR